ncbi:28S ribosomal protein S23, mitochondrial-like [Anneissia japonica]|uniref:28S ribosomal protein S23, mitochondrial-like n=1 Tax=Anneissia japonica TaxID=1529436 RepID=UPI001425BB8A|nr:28S ribosomal protein S23, mitochondrial-like [Anneissia japonica]
MTSLSRLERVGTIFTRTQNLIRSGVIKDADKPLWYEVMAAFPPMEEPKYERKISDDWPREILYKEDKVRAYFYKTFRNRQTIDLSKPDAFKHTTCYKFITKYQELDKSRDGKSDEDLLKEVEEALTSEGVILQRFLQKNSQSQVHDRSETERPNQETAPS